MKIWKLVSGILSIVFSGIVIFQSMAAGAYNALANTGDIGGSAGILVALLMIAGGIVSIVTKNSLKNGGNIALLIVFVLAGLVGIFNSAVYEDLLIWGIWCIICAAMALIIILKNRLLH